MRLNHLIVLATLSSGCQHAAPAPTVQSLTHDAVLTRLALGQQTRGLSTTDATEVGRFGAFVTQPFKGPPAPIDYMRTHCPERVLNAKTQPLYGLESPDASTVATLKADGIAAQQTDGYTGEYVVLDINGMLVSLFPDGVIGTDVNGKPISTPAKALQSVSAVAELAPWLKTDTNDRAWSGVRLTARLHTPPPPPDALGEVIIGDWKEPCK
jgi:hypothetical protein